MRRGARRAQQPVDASGNEHDHGHDHREHDGQAHRVAQAALGFHPVALAHAQRGQRVAAVAHEHGDGHEHRHDGHRHGGGGQADLAQRLPEEDRVDDVVRAVHQHAENGRDSEFDDEARDGCRAHATDYVVASRALRILAHGRAGAFFVEVEGGIRCFCFHEFAAAFRAYPFWGTAYCNPSSWHRTA